jgi:CheY-like chemotaxis protein
MAPGFGFNCRPQYEAMQHLDQTILIVEDNEDDVFAMKRALKHAKITNPLQIATTGRQALDYLSGKGVYSDRKMYPIPFMVFLDLKLPFINGFEILEWIRQQPALRQIVVIILTSSAESKDYERAYALGARTYLVKPPSSEMLRDAMTSLESLWLSSDGSMPIALEA